MGHLTSSQLISGPTKQLEDPSPHLYRERSYMFRSHHSNFGDISARNPKYRSLSVGGWGWSTKILYTGKIFSAKFRLPRQIGSEWPFPLDGPSIACTNSKSGPIPIPNWPKIAHMSDSNVKFAQITLFTTGAIPCDMLHYFFIGKCNCDVWWDRYSFKQNHAHFLKIYFEFI